MEVNTAALSFGILRSRHDAGEGYAMEPEAFEIAKAGNLEAAWSRRRKVLGQPWQYWPQAGMCWREGCSPCAGRGGICLC